MDKEKRLIPKETANARQQQNTVLLNLNPNYILRDVSENDILGRCLQNLFNYYHYPILSINVEYFLLSIKKKI